MTVGLSVIVCKARGGIRGCECGGVVVVGGCVRGNEVVHAMRGAEADPGRVEAVLVAIYEFCAGV